MSDTAMDLQTTLFHVRCQAMAYAVQTADKDEGIGMLMARANLIADFMVEPLLTKQQADGMGQAITEVRQ